MKLSVANIKWLITSINQLTRAKYNLVDVARTIENRGHDDSDIMVIYYQLDEAHAALTKLVNEADRTYYGKPISKPIGE